MKRKGKTLKVFKRTGPEKGRDHSVSMGDQSEEILKKAFSYAVKRKSFTKMSLIKQAENVCVYGLGRYFEEAFFRQRVMERFSVGYLCDKNERRLEELASDERVSSLRLVKPEELAGLKNPTVILMLGDPREALAYLDGIVGVENCITYNDLVLDELMTVDRPDGYYENSWDRLLQAFRLLEDTKSREIFVNTFCLRAAPHLAWRSYEELCTRPQYLPFRPGETGGSAHAGPSAVRDPGGGHPFYGLFLYQICRPDRQARGYPL